MSDFVFFYFLGSILVFIVLVAELIFFMFLIEPKIRKNYSAIGLDYSILQGTPIGPLKDKTFWQIVKPEAVNFTIFSLLSWVGLIFCFALTIVKTIQFLKQLNLPEPVKKFRYKIGYTDLTAVEMLLAVLELHVYLSSRKIEIGSLDKLVKSITMREEYYFDREQLVLLLKQNNLLIDSSSI